MRAIQAHLHHKYEKRRGALLTFGRMMLAVFLGEATIFIFRSIGYVKGGVVAGTIDVPIIITGLLWYIYMDVLIWLAKKIPDDAPKVDIPVE